MLTKSSAAVETIRSCGDFRQYLRETAGSMIQDFFADKVLDIHVTDR